MLQVEGNLEIFALKNPGAAHMGLLSSNKTDFVNELPKLTILETW